MGILIALFEQYDRLNIYVLYSIFDSISQKTYCSKQKPQCDFVFERKTITIRFGVSHHFGQITMYLLVHCKCLSLISRLKGLINSS